MGHSTPASAADPSTEETSTSTCGSSDTREAQPELDTCEPENTFSTTTNSKTNSDNSSSNGSSSEVMMNQAMNNLMPPPLSHMWICISIMVALVVVKVP